MIRRPAAWLGLSLLVAAFVVGIGAAGESVLAMRAAARGIDLPGMDERLTEVRVPEPWLLSQQGGRWGRYGWYLGPGESGSLRVQLPGSGPGALRLRVWTYDAGVLQARVIDTDTTQLVAHTDGRMVNLPVHGDAVLDIVAANTSDTEQLVLDRISACRSVANERPGVGMLPIALGLAITGWGVLAWYGRSTSAVRCWLGATAILVAVVVGWGQRWELLGIARGLPLDPDVTAYQEYARSLAWFDSNHGFYSGSFGEREPLHVAALHLWFGLFGDADPAPRLMTLVLSVLLVAMTGAFVWSVGNWFLGAAAAWIMAISPAWVAESVRGLRLEEMTLLTLVVLMIWLRGRGWSGALMLGAATGAAALLFSPALSVFLPLFWGAWLLNQWLRKRGRPMAAPSHWQWARLLFASVIAVALYVPHLHGLYKVHGDPSWPSRSYARWNANFEFPERLGTAGFPTKEEFDRSPYDGPPITYAEYMFDLHSIPRLLAGQVKGWIESTAYMSASVTPRLENAVVLFQASGPMAVARNTDVVTAVVFILSLILTVLGWVDLWRRPNGWWMPFLSLWGTWYVAYLYSVRLVEPFRHSAHVHPLLLFCLLHGGLLVFRWLQSARTSLRNGRA